MIRINKLYYALRYLTSDTWHSLPVMLVIPSGLVLTHKSPPLRLFLRPYPFDKSPDHLL
jgi:hypothetical protein